MRPFSSECLRATLVVMERIITVAGIAAAVAVIAIALGGVRVAPVHAQAGCSTGTLTGTYVYNFNGHFYNDNNDVFYYSAMGQMQLDGNGGITATETVSVDGLITRRKYNGTYNVNSDCSGSLSARKPDDGSQFSADLIVSDSGKEISVIQTDDGTVVSGIAKAVSTAKTVSQ